MTPQEIAREAARQHSPHPMPGLEQLILTAAAKMVRETGVHHLEAITTDQGRLCEAVHHGKGDYHTGLAPCPVCLRIEVALTALRALTEQPGKP